jgi:hypothetical protein
VEAIVYSTETIISKIESINKTTSKTKVRNVTIWNGSSKLG